MAAQTPRKDPRLRRRLAHVIVATPLPLMALLLPHWAVMAVAVTAAATLLVAEATRLAVGPVNRWILRRFGWLLKPQEERRVTSGTYLVVASTVTLALFQPPVAALAILYLALGDPAASIVGARFGRLRLPASAPWAAGGSGAKSVEGTLALLAVALAVAALLRGVGVYGVFWPAALGALVAAVVEHLPLPVDDNISVPLMGAAVMALLWAG
jgi:dolichol kinase